MLAEPRRKVKFSTDPRNTTWTNDDNKFGQKLMEKMGWAKGRGLGVKEDGNPFSIAVSLKQDKKGVGWSKKTEDNWIAHQDEFGALLSELNENHGTGRVTSDNSDSQKVLNLEHTSRSSKGRVHYQKFTKGKDLSVKSESDLDCVFGKRKSRSREITAQQLEENTLMEGEIAEKTPNDDSGGLKTVTSSDSVQEYFAKKMAVMNRRKNEDIIGISDTSQGLTAKDVESPSSILRNRSYDAESNDLREGKKKSRNSLKVRFSVGEGMMECDESKIEVDANSFVDTDTHDQVYKKKKKKSKKEKKESESEYKTLMEDKAACYNQVESETALDSHSKNAVKGKKKHKNSDLSENPVPEKRVEQETDLKTDEESAVKYEKAVELVETSEVSSPKKKKKRKMEIDLSTEEANGNINEKKVKTDVNVDVSSRKEKKKAKSKSRADIPVENDKKTENGNVFDKNIKLNTVDELSSKKNKQIEKLKIDKVHTENEGSIQNSPIQLNNEVQNKAESLSKKKRKHRDEQEDQGKATVEVIIYEQNVEKELEEKTDLSFKESEDIDTDVMDKHKESKKNKREEMSEEWQFEPPNIIDADKDLINPFPNTRPDKLLETYARDTQQDVRYIFKREGQMNKPIFAMYVVLGTRSFGAVQCSSKKEAQRKAAIVVLCELKAEVELKTLRGKSTIKNKGNKLDKSALKNVHKNKSIKQSSRHKEENQEQAFQGSCLQEISGYAGFPVSAEVQLEERKSYQPNRYCEKFQRKETFTKQFKKREMFDEKPYPMSNKSDFLQSKGTHKHFTD